MNNPFDYTPDADCREAFRQLTVWLDTLSKSGSADDVNFCSELASGKMLGVLIATDERGERHTLCSFSGQLGNGGFHRGGFVEPVFDYLKPDGYFKTREAEISRQNSEIAEFEENTLCKIRKEYEKVSRRMSATLAEYSEKCRLSKAKRDALRARGIAGETEMAAIIRQSQFEKAELRRLKNRLAAEMEPHAARLREAQAHLDALKKKRHSESEALQKWLFSNFKLLNARGESRSLSDIFAHTPMRTPPSGAGECCAPKLLQAAYKRGWQPVAMAEYWYGKPKGGEVRIHGAHYPACRGRCRPLLEWMLGGLAIEPPPYPEGPETPERVPEIIYENRWFCVVSKPGGMLSVPGKGKAVSVQQWLAEKYGSDKNVRMAHRLDQDTSGLIIATFGEIAYKEMQSLFAMRRVKKTYMAELEGDYESKGLPKRGCIDLPLSPDFLDRPRQRVDVEEGKPAVTYYEFTEVTAGRSRITFHPVTGRTHQLRVHAASEKGLGMPIIGDRLYGSNIDSGETRLHLHARKIEFTFPIDGHHYCFECPPPAS